MNRYRVLMVDQGDGVWSVTVDCGGTVVRAGSARRAEVVALVAELLAEALALRSVNFEEGVRRG